MVKETSFSPGDVGTVFMFHVQCSVFSVHHPDKRTPLRSWRLLSGLRG